MAGKIVSMNNLRSNFAHQPCQAKQSVHVNTRILGHEGEICSLSIQGVVEKPLFPYAANILAEVPRIQIRMQQKEMSLDTSGPQTPRKVQYSDGLGWLKLLQHRQSPPRESWQKCMVAIKVALHRQIIGITPHSDLGLRSRPSSIERFRSAAGSADHLYDGSLAFQTCRYCAPRRNDLQPSPVPFWPIVRTDPCLRALF
jgi:hypothetical protein